VNFKNHKVYKVVCHLQILVHKTDYGPVKERNENDIKILKRGRIVAK